jgi:hypothetical protein
MSLLTSQRICRSVQSSGGPIAGDLDGRCRGVLNLRPVSANCCAHRFSNYGTGDCPHNAARGSSGGSAHKSPDDGTSRPGRGTARATNHGAGCTTGYDPDFESNRGADNCTHDRAPFDVLLVRVLGRNCAHDFVPGRQRLILPHQIELRGSFVRTLLDSAARLQRRRDVAISALFEPVDRARRWR